MASVEDIEGVGSAQAAKLAAAGVKTLADLLEHGGSRGGREKLAESTGISGKLILEWVNRADLDRVKGVGSEFADLLEAAGVDSVGELAQRSAANLAAKMAEINETKKLVRRVPTASELEGWIADAKSLPKVVTH